MEENSGYLNFSIFKKTRKTLIYTFLLNEVFIAFFGLMPFILIKDLSASTFQISLFTMLKPSVAVLSFYWSSRIIRTKRSLRNNLIISGVLARILFLFFPFFKNVWYMIFISALYMLFSRASIPSWMEILKLNMPKKTREKLFSLGSIVAYVEGVMIALFIGYFLDVYSNGWKVIFVFSSVLGLVSVFLQMRTPIFLENIEISSESIKKSSKFSFKSIIKPWKEGIQLIKEKKDFAKFQMGTMVTMFGFMLSIPAFFLFYANNLNLSHTEIIVGRYIFMGLGFVFFSYFWAKAMQKFHINFLTGYVCLGFTLFPVFLLFSVFSKVWLYIGFLSYGITQAGSQLIWNMSGPTFAKNEDSSKFTTINVLMVGIRGLIAPLLGGILCELFGPIVVFLISISISSFGSYIMFRKKGFVFNVEA